MTKRKQSYLAFIALAVGSAAFASGCGSSASSASNANAQPTTVAVTTEAAVIKPVPTYIEATGSLASDAQTDVAPNVSGKIVEVNFDIGSYVSQGDVLVRLDPRDGQIRVEQAKAQVEQQRQTVNQANAQAEQALATLRQTQARLGIGDGETFQIKDFSQVKTFSAQLQLAEIELRRAEKLLESGDVSKSYYDTRRSQRDALIGNLDEARSNAAQAIKAIDTARAGYNAAKAAANASNAAIATLQATVAAAEKSVTDTIIRSPISGYVSEKVADVGEYISPNTPNSKIATILRTSTLRMRIDIPEASVGKVATGQGISLQTAAYPDRSFAGTVVRIAPNVSTTGRTMTVEAEVQNSEGLLKPGQFATVRITQSKPEPAVVIPARAVKTTGDINSVFVVKDGVAREQFVQLGLLEGDMIQVKNGVVDGDRIVVSDLSQLRDGIMVSQ